ncbi:MAG: sulfite exporter TauE/SafE family protein [Candidatus Omnitrophica bacterium]|nr:sulfite exporter TauE/SafE family protein [Candidatus Omnitrophota bacterium]MBI2496112.1 sulfite exporter TauE/SafE family protein [Candidatus Omnitrophota bacterium]MBI3021340.1 sulfite exporter TauE/SafE family protein [Candidatus Omnitrophota bacterium]
MRELWWLIPAFFMIALVYASVGHGGASGYLAALSFVVVRPDEMATTALTLNLFVAGMALMSFVRAGHFISRLTWPFVISSAPCALLGGLTVVPVRMYSWLLAAALSVAAIRLMTDVSAPRREYVKAPGLAIVLPIGGGVGWLSGLVGIGGGVFLSPLMLLLGWATPKQAAASSAGFIVANSAAALVGRWARQGIQYGPFWPLLIAALAGGIIGARLGANHFSGKALKRLLAVILLIAAVKLLLHQGIHT